MKKIISKGYTVIAPDELVEEIENLKNINWNNFDNEDIYYDENSVGYSLIKNDNLIVIFK